MIKVYKVLSGHANQMAATSLELTFQQNTWLGNCIDDHACMLSLTAVGSHGGSKTY